MTDLDTQVVFDVVRRAGQDIRLASACPGTLVVRARSARCQDADLDDGDGPVAILRSLTGMSGLYLGH